MASDGTTQLKENVEDSAKDIPDSSPLDVQLKRLSITDKQKSELDSHASPLKIADVRPASTGSTGLPSESTSSAPHVSLVASLQRSVPPLSESSLNVPALPPPFLQVTFQEADVVEQVKAF